MFPQTSPNQVRQDSLKNTIEFRNYNIITQADTKVHQKLIQLPKLGYKKDYPYPRNNFDYEKNIDFSAQKNQYTQPAGLKNSQSEQKINLMNANSLKYNFITQNKQDGIKQYDQLREDQPKIAYKTQQIAKITDFQRLFATNINPDFQQQIKANPNCFKKQRGMCAETFNRMASYGPFNQPFRKFK